MSTREKRRQSFNAVAEDYATRRPGYPQQMIDDAIALSGIPAGGRILEIGCGPGTASLPFAERGYAMLCLELGPDLAEVARRRMACFPSVQVATTRFEDWPLEPEAFDMVLAAMSLHWVKRDVAYSKSAATLRPGGSLAVFSNVVRGFGDPDLQAAMEELAGRYLAKPSRRVDKLSRRILDHVCSLLHRNLRQSTGPHMAWKDRRHIAKLQRLGGFSQVLVRHYEWSEVYDAEVYVQLLETYSDYRILSLEAREELYAQMRRLIDTHGGSVTRLYESRLFLAKKAG